MSWFIVARDTSASTLIFLNEPFDSEDQGNDIMSVIMSFGSTSQSPTVAAREVVILWHAVDGPVVISWTPDKEKEWCLRPEWRGYQGDSRDKAWWAEVSVTGDAWAELARIQLRPQRATWKQSIAL